MKRLLLVAGLLVSFGSLAKSLGDGKVANRANDVRPLLVGQLIPSVKVTKPNGKETELRWLVARKPTVIVFYRGGWCPYCNLQLKELKDATKDLKSMGFQILAISSDKPAELNVTQKKHDLEYELYSDSSAVAASEFGIAFHVDGETISNYKTHNIDIEKASGNSDHVLPVPAVFLVNQSGEILFEYVNPNYKVRLQKDILVAAAKANAPKGK